MPDSKSARRSDPKNQTLSRLIGPPRPPSNWRTIAVVGVPPALAAPGWQPALAAQLSTLLPFHPTGWYAYAAEPLNVLPPLLVTTLMFRPVPIGAEASMPPVFT